MSIHSVSGQIERINTILPTTSASNTVYTLNSKQSGSIIFLDEDNFEDTSIIRLPKPDYGLNFKIINKTNGGSKTIYIKSYDSTQTLTALIYKANCLTNVTPPVLANTITIDFSNTDIGDEVNIICDGTYWYANGIVLNTTAYT
jgi:hypothetical protein